MDNKMRSKYMWGMFLPVIIIIAVENLLEIFMMECLFVYKMGTYTSGKYMDFVADWIKSATSPTANSILSVAYSLICLIIFGYMYIKWFNLKDRAKHPFRGMADNCWLMAAGIVVFSIGMQYLCIYLMNSIAMMRPDWLAEYQELLDLAGLGDELTAPMLLYAVVLAPICEELAFRGICFKSARKIMPIQMAIVIQAAMFAAFHMNALQACYTFVVGLGLGYIMYRYDNIIVTIIVHMVYNFIGAVISEILPMGGNSFGEYFAWFLGSLIVSYAGLLLLHKAAPGVIKSQKTSDN